MMKGQGYMETLEPRVLHFIEKHNLVSGQQCLLVAVSGGPDSVCLLHILVRLQSELNIRLHVAHLNHQLRGAESEADAQYVSQLAHQLGIPVIIEQRDVKAYQARRRISPEEAAREVRYAFLVEVADSINASRVAVGHTTDDHVETVLMHLIRGTGTRGLRGLLPSNRWQSSGNKLTVIRPLLEVSRQETLAYCYNQQLKPRIDATNFSLSPLRNRIRHQLLPLLRGYNPRVDEALLRTADIVGADLAFFNGESERLLGKIARRQGDTIILDKERFIELPLALKRYLLQAAIEELLGNLRDVEFQHTEKIMALLAKPAGKKFSLPGGLVFVVEYGQYVLSLDPTALSPFPVLGDEFTLKIPGETSVSGWCVEATVVNREQMRDKDSNFTAYLDLDKTGEEVVVRCRQRGDRFQPLGMEQPKKVGEFMIDAKIPRAWRQQVPIVCSPQQVLWVVGWRIDDRVKITESTKRILCLKFERASDA